MEAKIQIEYDDVKTAEAVAKAVSPDNIKTPKGLTVKTSWKNKHVYTEIKCKISLLTFIATIDDLLSAISTAEKTIKTVQSLDKNVFTLQD
ncbi:MAG: KEOPS complex subunit Pcc1 [Candidatus Bathyarchaeia archaeon]